MAIRVRRGLKQDFDPNKLLSGELATPLDTRELYAAFAPGDVQKIATYENVQEMVGDATEEVIAEFIESVTEATESAQTATQGANTAATHATTEGDYAKAQGDYAKAQGDAAASIVHDNIATPTIPGNVRGGGDIVVDQTTGDMTAPTKLDKTGDSKDNTTSFTQAATLTNIVSGEKHSTIFGKVMKFLSFIGTTTLTTVAQTITEAINELKTWADSAVTSTATDTQIADLNSFMELNKLVGINYAVTQNFPPNTGATYGKAINIGFAPGVFNQYAYLQEGITLVRKYIDWVAPKWGEWKKILTTADLVTTDTENNTGKALGANVGYALGQEIDVINTTKYNTYPTTGFASGETILGFTNACTVNTCKLIAGGNFPSDLPSDATSSEGFVEVLVGFGPRKTVRFTRYDGTAMYLRMNFGNSWFNEWKKVTLTTI